MRRVARPVRCAALSAVVTTALVVALVLLQDVDRRHAVVKQTVHGWAIMDAAVRTWAGCTVLAPLPGHDDHDEGQPDRILVRRLHERIKNGSDWFNAYVAINDAHRTALCQSTHPRLAPAQFVMYACDEHNYSSGCGGIGDRLRGLVSAFYLALLTDRGFFVRWEHGYPWTPFVQPRRIDWRVPLDAHDLSWMNSEEIWMMDTLDPAMKELFSTRDVAHVFADVQLIACHGNVYTVQHLLENPHLQANVAKYRLRELDQQGLLVSYALRALIQPTALIDDALTMFARSIATETSRNDTSFFESLHIIGVHLRLGWATTWSDPPRVPMNGIASFATAAAELVANAPATASTHVFVASDSHNATAFVSDYLSLQGNDVHTMDSRLHNGQMEHVDRSPNQTLQGNLRTWSEWFLLAASDQTVLSRSGFGEHASAFTCHPAIFFGVPANYNLTQAGRLPHGFCTLLSEALQRIEGSITRR